MLQITWKYEFSGCRWIKAETCTQRPTCAKGNWQQINDNDNDNDNILFNHILHIEIIMYNSLENQIINWSGDYY